MKKINLENTERGNTYNWFKTFSNTTYGFNVSMDVTELVKHTKKNNESFFINLLYIVVKGLNSIEEFRMRLVDDEVVIYEDINPAFTVMTKADTFENVRFKNCSDYKTFYNIAHEKIEEAKNQLSIKKDNYNPEGCFDEYYITCIPWLDFSGMSHPIPDSKESQVIPRICWGKYVEEEGKYKMMLNITVSHMFIDGYPLSVAFNTIQEYLNNVTEILK